MSTNIILFISNDHIEKGNAPNSCMTLILQFLYIASTDCRHGRLRRLCQRLQGQEPRRRRRSSGSSLLRRSQMHMENDIKFKSDEDIYENIMNYLILTFLIYFRFGVGVGVSGGGVTSSLISFRVLQDEEAAVNACL